MPSRVPNVLQSLFSFTAMLIGPRAYSTLPRWFHDANSSHPDLLSRSRRESGVDDVSVIRVIAWLSTEAGVMLACSTSTTASRTSKQQRARLSIEKVRRRGEVRLPRSNKEFKVRSAHVPQALASAPESFVFCLSFWYDRIFLFPDVLATS